MLGTDFDVDRDGELAVQLGLLADRYRAAISA
jgi:hypothetical protein